MHKRVKFSKEETDYIINQYLLNHNTTEIAKKLNSYNTSIRRILKRNNIKTLNLSESQSIRGNVFNSNSEESFYWLGFLAADGTIHSKSNRILLGSAEKDEKHLEKYSLFVKSNIKKVFNKRFNIFEIRVQFRNKEIKQYLENIGITSNKSKTLELNIPLNSHMLRGVFDGDGYTRKGIFEIATASEKFAKQIVNFLKENEIHSTNRKLKTGLFIVGVYTKSSAKKLFDLFYKDATIFLERKKKVLCPFYNENY